MPQKDPAEKAVREEWIEADRAAECGVCTKDTGSRMLLLQRPPSRML
jgi:hypothetical protein